MSSTPSLKDFYIEKFQYMFNQKDNQEIKPTILIVDDEENNLQLLERTLRKEYNILVAKEGEEALNMVKKYGEEISLIISDQKMPNMTGAEFLEKVSEIHPKIIKILLTGYSDADAIMACLNRCQIFQYLSKPFNPEDLKVCIKNGINAYNLTLSRESLLQDLKELYFTTIKAISSALDAKDNYTHGHSYRVTLYSLIISKELAFDDDFIEEIEIAGLLHDIGKIGVPQDILCKPGKLTQEEYEIIKSHPERGKKILNNIGQLNTVALWVNNHHERWDGKGYPLGLKEKEIPLPSRILAIADTYDAMTSNRSYRKGLSHEIAIEEIQRCAGSQFDPEIAKIFVEIQDVVKEALNNPAAYYSKYSVLDKSLKGQISR